MANKDLINLGITPDSGTGDSARLGGAKINTLFADIYSQFGALATNTDTTSPFYGTPLPIPQFANQVGELHPSGNYRHVRLTPDSDHGLFDNTPANTGWNDQRLAYIDGVAVPELYTLSNWYFMSRGESITLDMSLFAPPETDPPFPGTQAAFIVLPLAQVGDTVRIRDSYGTWFADGYALPIYIFASPLQWTSGEQIQNFINYNTTSGYGTDADVSRAANLSTDGISFVSASYKTYAPSFAPGSGYTYNRVAPSWNIRYAELELVYLGPYTGWVMRRSDLAPASSIGTKSSGQGFTKAQWIQIPIAVAGTIDDAEEQIVPAGWYVLPFKTADENDPLYSPQSQIIQIYRNVTAANRAQTPFINALRNQLSAAQLDEFGPYFTTDSAPALKQVTLSILSDSTTGYNFAVSETPFDGVVKFSLGA